MGRELGKIDAERNVELAAQAKALEKARKEFNLEMAQTGLSAAGIADPTPICDTINAGISFARGDIAGGLIDLASGWLPYIGDSLKTLKAGKTANKIADLKKEIETANKWLKKYQMDRAKEAARRVREARKAKACQTPCGESKWGTQLPSDKNGSFNGGERGNSTWTSKDGQVTVEYKEGHPDFNNATLNGKPVGDIKEVEIPQTGNNKIDFPAADKAAGFTKENPRPADHTWHHKEDGVTMQLVPKDVHNRTIGGAPHTGGASIVKDPQF